MKKLFFIVCCAALLVTGCKDGKNSPESANVHLADSLNEVIAQRDSEINDMMGTFNEVQEGLRQISEAEGRVALAKSGEGTSSKQKMKEDIQFIAAQMKKNKELRQFFERYSVEEDYRGSSGSVGREGEAAPDSP